ncbi:hypothetical protein [Kineococcus glutinatus]|uniref:Uncharacterized protein n=1 Tax=Kineococcus glutinatus TaxID=1070872 RepID=A0ABP9HPM8_9ACTN
MVDDGARYDVRHDPQEVQTLVLPASGWLLQWRSDACWREVQAEQYQAELDGMHQPMEEYEWVPWSGTYHPGGRGGGRWDGTATWWLLRGELPDGAWPEVVLADGQHPPILHVGKVWACEWVSPAQPATLRLGAEEHIAPFAEPLHRRHHRQRS